MANATLQLRQEDAKLVFLAIAYHLGRPGSELDPITKQTVEHGLAEVAASLQPQLRLAVATIELRANQAQRLLSAMLGSITELKAYAMLGAGSIESGTGHRSTVPGFDSSLRHLFPEIEEDPDAPLEMAERILRLRRRLEDETAGLEDEPKAAAESRKRKGWWPFGR
ncbi:MAG TPA: hypothetical protein VG845_13495 [Dehalococcoidia bacterium]|jgi:hypothetical protein|nr:hypothetical protein [Dehalococcoidia bacterium]